MTDPLPIALSLSGSVQTVGAYAGFAAVFGLAVLALLYFAQARELRRLSEWAARAPERGAATIPAAAGGNAVTGAPGAQPGAFRSPAGPTPVAARPGPASSLTPPPTAVPAGSAPGPVPPGAPSTTAARAAAPGVSPPPSAAVVPHPPTSPGGPGLPGSAPTAAGSSPPLPAGSAVAPRPQSQQSAPGTVVSPAAGTSPPAPGGAGVAPPPPRPPGPPPGVPRAPAPPISGGPGAAWSGTGTGPGAAGAAAGLADPPVRAGAAQSLSRPPAPSRRPATSSPLDRDAPRTTTGEAGLAAGRRPAAAPGLGRRWLGLAAGGLILLVVLVFAATQLFGGGGGGGAGGAKATSAAAARTPSSQPAGATGPASSSVRVTVLNGSGVPGLARRISLKLTNSGYRRKNVSVGNAPTAQNQTTVVGYAAGQQAAAQEVARKIGADPAMLTPLGGATAVGSPQAQVVVTVGADLRQ